MSLFEMYIDNSYFPDNQQKSKDEIDEFHLKLWREFLKTRLPGDDKPRPPAFSQSAKKTVIKDKKKCYALTLTTTEKTVDKLNRDLEKVLDSKIFGINKYKIGRELTKEGCPHYHLLIENDRSIYASDIKKVIGKDKIFHCKLLKGSLDKQRWNNYINKKKTDEEKSYYSDLSLECYEEIDISEI